jgi:hypothetical protein
MASKPPTPSLAPPGVPPSGNGRYIVAVVLLLGLVGVIVAWKMSQKPPEPVVVRAALDAGPPVGPKPGRNLDDDIPLPPPVVDAGPEAGPPKVTYAKVDNQCDAKTCSGSGNTEMESQLSFRVRQARRCYNAALAQDNTLKGKLSVRVRVGLNGAVCSANVTSDDIGNASLASCVASTFRGASFPAPRGGCVDVNVPVNFVPGQ